MNSTTQTQEEQAQEWLKMTTEKLAETAIKTVEKMSPDEKAKLRARIKRGR